MSNTPKGWQRRRPPRHPKARQQACLGMRQGFYTHSRIMEEPGEEEGSPRLVVGKPIVQWPPLVSQTIPWEPRGGHRQPLEQAVLVC